MAQRPDLGGEFLEVGGTAPLRAAQGLANDFAQLGVHRPPMPGGGLTQALLQLIVQIAQYDVGHGGLQRAEGLM
jgi:hypothetical protein